MNKLKQILNKLGNNKTSADSHYRQLMAEIQKTSARIDTIEKEQTQVVNALDYVRKDVEE